MICIGMWSGLESARKPEKPEDDMAFTGDLQSISLSDIFQNLSQNERTGRLRIAGTGSFDLFFRKGKVAGVERSDGAMDEYMLGVLKKRGSITAEEFGRVTKKSGRPAGPVCTAFKMKLITQKDADHLLEYYVSERVLDAFSVEKGTFEFIEGDEGFKDSLTEWQQFPLSIEAGKLMFEAARRSDEWARINKNIISEDEIFEPCLNIRESVREGITGEDLEVLVNIDGLRTLREVVDASRESKFSVFRAVCRLIESRIIKPLEVNQTLRLASRLFDEKNYQKCIEVARKGLSVERNTPSLRHILARALSKTGQESLAAEELKLLALSSIDNGQPLKAVEIYREVVDIVPSDVDSRQRIFDIIMASKPPADAIEEGKGFISALRSFGLNARAKDILRKLLDMNSEDIEVQRSYAEVMLDLGDKAEGLKVYRRLGDALLNDQRMTAAAAIFAEIVKIDPADERSHRLLNEIREGVFKEKEKKRRLAKRVVAAVFLAGGLCLWLVYDTVARAAYVEMNRKAATAVAAGRFDDALACIEDFRTSYPFTISQASARKYSWTLRVLASLDQARKESAGGRRGEARRWYEDALKKAKAHLGPEDQLVTDIGSEIRQLDPRRGGN